MWWWHHEPVIWQRLRSWLNDRGPWRRTLGDLNDELTGLMTQMTLCFFLFLSLSSFIYRHTQAQIIAKLHQSFLSSHGWIIGLFCVLLHVSLKSEEASNEEKIMWPWHSLWPKWVLIQVTIHSWSETKSYFVSSHASSRFSLFSQAHSTLLVRTSLQLKLAPVSW